MRVFQPYNPDTIQRKASLRACEACYTRKVKCDSGGHERFCQNCVSHGIECRPRTRKRKSTVLLTGNGPPADTSDLNGNIVNQGASRRRVSASHNQERRFGSQQGDTRLSAPLLFVTHLSPDPDTVSPRTSSSVDAFHNSSYLSRSAILGDEFPDIDHSHTDRGVREHTLSPTDLEVLRLYHAFDLPDPPLRQSLIEAYVDKCWTWMPVVDISSLSGSFAAGEDSFLLLQAVLLVGSLMRPELCTKETSDEYYRRVKALVNAGFERNPINILASLCLIQWYTPTAPRDISTDTPRFWETYALGLAQQMGLHKASRIEAEDHGLRRRIWWTLRSRDSLIASAHGRPRILNPADCTVELPNVKDFGEITDGRPQIFVFYVKIVEILGDLCHLLTRESKITPQERADVSARLRDYIQDLPDSLRLNEIDGSVKPYNFELAQFHVPILTAITILHRPRSIFSLGVANAASIVAANLTFRIVEAIYFREQTKFLSSAYAWFLLAASIPHLSCLTVERLKSDASAALDTLEAVLSTLGRVRPAAANNLRNVRAIRRAVNAHNRSDGGPRPEPESDLENNASPDAYAPSILQAYGPEIFGHYQSLVAALENTSTAHCPDNGSSSVHDETESNGIQLATSHQSFEATPIVATSTPGYGVQESFTILFEEELQGSVNFWMRDWMENLQYMPE